MKKRLTSQAPPGNVQKVLQKEMKYKEGHGIRVNRKRSPKSSRTAVKAMTHRKCKGSRINLQKIFGVGKDSFKELIREALRTDFFPPAASGVSLICKGSDMQTIGINSPKGV